MHPETEKRGSILVETALSVPLFLFTVFFVVDISLATLCIHKLNYQVSRLSRLASLSAGKTCYDVTRSILGRLALSLKNEIKSGRLKRLSVSVTDEKGRKIPKKRTLKPGQIIRVKVRGTYSSYLVPWALMVGGRQGKFLKVSSSGKSFTFEITRRTIVE